MFDFFKSEAFKTTATVAAGWLFSELSHYLSDRRERRKAIGRALADLLEIRHRFTAMDTLFKELRKIAPDFGDRPSTIAKHNPADFPRLECAAAEVQRKRLTCLFCRTSSRLPAAVAGAWGQALNLRRRNGHA